MAVHYTGNLKKCLSLHLPGDARPRPTVEYHPSVWGDYFIRCPPSFDEVSIQAMQRRSEDLKEKVRKAFIELLILHADEQSKTSMGSLLTLVDAVQRLGLEHHFATEIRQVLKQIYSVAVNQSIEDQGLGDLHALALRFRLLREEGYSGISPDVFKRFMVDEDGNFSKDLIADDVKGLLSLYDAAYLGTHGEEILDIAIGFCREQLTSKLDTIPSVTPEVKAMIAHTLATPIHRRIKKLATRYYIPIYEQVEGHGNPQLLELSKLDFNVQQASHREEVKNICLWWKELGLASKLTFARDRVVECYFWILGVLSEPSFARARIIMTKAIALTSILDDIYDAYGTLEELEPFTCVFQRWNVGDLNQLPEYMQVYLAALHRTFKGFEDELEAEGLAYRVDFLKKEMSDLARAYLQETRWRDEACTPTFEAHLSVSLVTSAYRMLACASLVGMDKELVTEEAFRWVSSFPKLIKASCLVCRLMDDLVSEKLEQERDHVVSTVESYMAEFKTTREETCKKFQIMIEDAWKDINQETQFGTLATSGNVLDGHHVYGAGVSADLLAVIKNLTRMIVTNYTGHDLYTHSSEVTKERVALLLVQPIHI